MFPSEISRHIGCQAPVRIAVALFLIAALTAVTDPSRAATAAPNGLKPNIFVLSPDWVSSLPPKGRVNPPDSFSTLQPGQPFMLGLLAEGPDRAKAFEGVELTARFSCGPGGPFSEAGQKPVAVRA